MVPKAGLEPARRVTTLDFESSASANSATSAIESRHQARHQHVIYYHHIFPLSRKISFIHELYFPVSKAESSLMNLSKINDCNGIIHHDASFIDNLKISNKLFTGVDFRILMPQIL